MKKHWYISLLLIAASVLLYLIPAPPRIAEQNGQRLRCKVLSVDNSDLKELGQLLYGSQLLQVELRSAPYTGQVFAATNELRSQMELDKVFEPGDQAIAITPNATLKPEDVLIAQDYNRMPWGMVLFGLFCVLLCVFGKWTGFNALLSFIFSCLVIWKAVIPLVLRGYSPSLVIFIAVFLLTAAIMYLVAGGINARGITAFLGSILGVLTGLVTAHFFTTLMKINGATLPYAQTILYSGYPVNLRDIFIGALLLASSGAVMDLGMDIASGMEEVVRHSPNLSRQDLIQSGLRMGRNVVGTMTTTLLLAYSGGYITMLMMFCAQGTSPWTFINNPLVASEAVKTLVGSFSLVTVAPFTALVGAFVLKPTRTGKDDKDKNSRPESVEFRSRV